MADFSPKAESKIYWMKPMRLPPSWWQAAKPRLLESTIANQQSAIEKRQLPDAARDTGWSRSAVRRIAAPSSGLPAIPPMNVYTDTAPAADKRILYRVA
jgi:hypothetical protein